MTNQTELTGHLKNDRIKLSSLEKCSVLQVDDIEVTVKHKNLLEEEEEQDIDANFFDDEFDLAVSTAATKVWPGSFLTIDHLTTHNDVPPLKNLKVIEMGSGTGMLGMYMAMEGAHVLMTDAAPVVKDTLLPNIELNVFKTALKKDPQITLQQSTKNAHTNMWSRHEGFHLGSKGGSISAVPLNWAKTMPTFFDDLEEQNKHQLIVACECVWLREILEPFSSTLKFLLEQGAKDCKALVTYPVRTLKTESVFSNYDHFVDALQGKGLKLQRIFFHDNGGKPDERDVYMDTIFLVTLQ